MSKFIGACDKYFLALALIQSFVVIFIDAKKFKNKNKNKTAKQCKVLGTTVAIICIFLYIAHLLFNRY